MDAIATGTHTPRNAWIEAGLAALAAGGPDAIRIEVLAKNLGVTKGGFYGYFTDRNCLLEEILEAWERASTVDVLAHVESAGGDSKAKLRRAGALTFSAELLPLDLAVRDWARRDPAVAARLRRVDNKRMEYLRLQFAEQFTDFGNIEAYSMLAFSLVIGNHFIAADHSPHNRGEVMERAVRLLGL